MEFGAGTYIMSGLKRWQMRNKVRTIFIGITLTSACMMYAAGENYNDDLAVRVILGEAADQSFRGKVAVGEVIRNRGKIKGFSSTLKDLDRFSREQPERTRTQARLAWIVSRFTNFTRGADHFDNVKAFGEPEWAKGMKKTVKIGDTQFYKSRE